MHVVDDLNGMMQELAGREGRLLYVAVNDLLRDEARCYLADQLHLTPEGYVFVAERIKESL